MYRKAHANATEARRELGAYFRFYHNQRPHQALGYRTPAEVFQGDPIVLEEESKYGEVFRRTVVGIICRSNGTLT